MFYNYLNSIFTIVTECNSKSNEFNQMLRYNARIISDFKALQSGKKSQSQRGGVLPMEAFEAIRDRVFESLKRLEDFHLQQYDATPVITHIEQTRKALMDLIAYITIIHTLMPKDENFRTILQQMTEMKDILAKY